jgi:hypothetical protein
VPNRHGPQHWRDIAEEAKVMADSFHESTARLAMLEIADRCERIAQRSERIAQSREERLSNARPDPKRHARTG